jgi:hypothetical protein
VLTIGLWDVVAQWLILILTAWEFKKPFCKNVKICPGWFKQNIFLKIKNALQKI